MIATKSQNVHLEDIQKRINGWAFPLIDKTFHNDLTDVKAINFPKSIKEYENFGTNSNSWGPIKTCSSFVYSAFLKPGHHQFMIYIPERVISIREDEEPGQILPSGGLKD